MVINIYIYRERERERVRPSINFDKSTVRLNYLCIFSILAKFQGDQRSIAMSSIDCLNSSFCSLK